MMLRNLQTSDIPDIRRIYERRGLNFGLPDMTRRMAVEKVLTANGEVVMAAILRPTTEAYIIVDPNWESPWIRWQAFQSLHAEALAECREKRIEDTQAVLDAPIEKAFGRRLLQLGWGRHSGVLYSRKAWEPADMISKVPVSEIRKAG